MASSPPEAASRRVIAVGGLGLAPSLYILAAALLGAAFIRNARWDLQFTGLFWNAREGFYLGDRWWVVVLYEAIPILTVSLSVLLLGLLGLALLRRQTFGPFTTRALLFLVVTLVAGPGLVVNWLFKDHWGRPRPRDVEAFGGALDFVPALVPGGACERNCSFVAGHPSSVFWLAAFGFLLAGGRRYAVFTASALAGLVAGYGRILQGAHFLSDVLFSGIFTFGTIYVLARWVFRIPPLYGTGPAAS